MPTKNVGLYATDEYHEAIAYIAWKKRISVSRLTREVFDKVYGDEIQQVISKHLNKTKNVTRIEN